MEVADNLKIVVIYDTLTTAIRAREIADRLAGELRFEDEIDCDFWNFDLLVDPLLRVQAAAEASASSITIVATCAPDALPIHVRTWLDNLPLQVRDDLAALVALVDAPEEFTGELPPVCQYLRHVATERNMDFFCKAGNRWEFDLVPIKESISPQNYVFSDNHVPTHRDYVGRGWGIND